MRILAFSDVPKWDGYERLVDRYKPDVVALAGDLTSDGHAAFWGEALESIPGYRRQLEALGRSGKLNDEWLNLKGRYRHTNAYRTALAALRAIHERRFYRFLRHAGKVSRVLVVKGDHDNDFAGNYDPKRIDKIPGCREISGKTFTLNKVVFLGLGFRQAGYRRILRRFISDFKGRVGIVIAHAPQKNVQLIAELKPRLLIRGHFAGGRYIIDGIPTVFTSGGHAVIQMGRKGLPRIRQPGHEVDWEQASAWLQDYPWLQPYRDFRLRAANQIRTLRDRCCRTP